MTVSTATSAAGEKHRAVSTHTEWLAGSGFGLAGDLLIPLCGRKRRTRITILSSFLLMLLVPGMLGCGSSGNSVPINPMVGTYSVKVTAKATAGPARSATVSVTITQ